VLQWPLISLVCVFMLGVFSFFFQAEDGIRDLYVTGVQTCALPISFAPTPCKRSHQTRCRRRERSDSTGESSESSAGPQRVPETGKTAPTQRQEQERWVPST